MEARELCERRHERRGEPKSGRVAWRPAAVCVLLQTWGVTPTGTLANEPFRASSRCTPRACRSRRSRRSRRLRRSRVAHVPEHLSAMNLYAAEDEELDTPCASDVCPRPGASVGTCFSTALSAGARSCAAPAGVFSPARARAEHRGGALGEADEEECCSWMPILPRRASRKQTSPRRAACE